jgi:hypothetical protein
MPGQCLKLGHNRFLSNLFRFIIHLTTLSFYDVKSIMKKRPKYTKTHKEIQIPSLTWRLTTNLCNFSVHYHCQQTSSLASILNHLNPDHAFKCYFFRFILILYLHLSLGLLFCFFFHASGSAFYVHFSSPKSVLHIDVYFSYYSSMFLAPSVETYHVYVFVLLNNAGKCNDLSRYEESMLSSQSIIFPAMY